MRAFSYAWSLPVTWQRWRSYLSICRSQKSHAARKVHGSVEPELLLIEVLHCGHRDFRPLLLLWPWPWPDDLHVRTWIVFQGGTPDVQIWTSYFTSFESYPLIVWKTDRCQTNRQDRSYEYIRRRFADGQLHVAWGWKNVTVIYPQLRYAIHGIVSLSVIELARMRTRHGDYEEVEERQNRKRKYVPGMRSDDEQSLSDWLASGRARNCTRTSWRVFLSHRAV